MNKAKKYSFSLNQIFTFFRLLIGLKLLCGVIFCIFAKVHLFCVRRSAANIDFNKCNDVSVPKSQQRYNPNILRGIKVEMVLASIIVDLFIKLVYLTGCWWSNDAHFAICNTDIEPILVCASSFLIHPFHPIRPKSHHYSFQYYKQLNSSKSKLRICVFICKWSKPLDVCCAEF